MNQAPTVLGLYRAATPGVDTGDNITVLPGDEAEPQPDLDLRVQPEFGGQSRTTGDGYVDSPLELIIEIAHSTRAIDLHGKYDDDRRHGVLEYLVACLDERFFRWYDLLADRELQADADGVIWIRTFPGLWIDGGALMAGEHARLLATAQAGLVTPEHAEFVRRLELNRQTPRP
ncbi:MAG: Uma2 family endonuclease [Planctomycetaceae bacterium]|nr:Uma2 family endonuclease [Planctomycetaceae bacterium]